MARGYASPITWRSPANHHEYLDSARRTVMIPPMNTEARYSLADLARIVGVTPRTVRYYIVQGLLPGANDPGPAAWYDDRHASRLRLIRELQRQHLPLAEIRARLAELSDDEVTCPPGGGDVETAHDPSRPRSTTSARSSGPGECPASRARQRHRPHARRALLRRMSVVAPMPALAPALVVGSIEAADDPRATPRHPPRPLPPRPSDPSGTGSP